MQKLKSRLGVGLVLLLVAASISLFYQSRGVSYLSYTVVDSLEHVSFDDVDEALVPYLSYSFWEVDLIALKQSLEKLNWIESATVKRSWPGYLDISIKEHKPIARWGDYDLISESGDIFRPVSRDGFDDLIYLNGDRLQVPELMDVLSSFQRNLSGLDWRVIALSQQVDGVFRAELDNGKGLIVDSAGWETKLPRFVKAYPMLSKKLVESAQSYDLRYSNGVAVKTTSASITDAL